MADGDPEDTGSLRQHLLVLRCQAGDEHAFAQLYDRFSGRTLRYLKGLLDESVAEDVQQEVWLTVFRRIGELVNPHRFKTWLYRTTRHRAIDFLRREKRELNLLQANAGDIAELFEGSVKWTVETSAHPGLDAALASLSPAHREVLILRFWEEMSYTGIGLIVGCSVGTVRSRLHHAKRNLNKALEEDPSPRSKRDRDTEGE